MTSADGSSELEELAHKLAVLELAARYGDHADHGEWAAFAQLFTVDGVFDATLVIGKVLTGRAEIEANFAADDVSVAHHPTNVIFERTGPDRGRARMKMLIIGATAVSSIDYDWELALIDGEWKIAHQRLVPMRVMRARRPDSTR
ncbi:MAG: nuclear transport factor 2 family protein [Acidimicrobiia bacterium]